MFDFETFDLRDAETEMFLAMDVYPDDLFRSRSVPKDDYECLVGACVAIEDQLRLNKGKVR